MSKTISGARGGHNNNTVIVDVVDSAEEDVVTVTIKTAPT